MLLDWVNNFSSHQLVYNITALLLMLLFYHSALLSVGYTLIVCSLNYCYQAPTIMKCP
uniref:Uncharacterized protein n=1 Tax=Arundo donax TaxID=35708 RepID=A0A0A9EIY7_ARUDO